MTRPSCFFASDVARAVDKVRMLADEYQPDATAFLRAVAGALKDIAEEAKNNESKNAKA